MGSGTEGHASLAGDVGRLLARLNVHLLTGGGQGVMLEVSRAFTECRDREGSVLGILPCARDDPGCAPKPGYPNPWVEIAIATHLPLSGERGQEAMSRNHVNVLTSDVVIALPGGSGTSCETRLALRYVRPIVAYLGPQGAIPDLDPRIPTAADLGELEAFLRKHLPAARSRM
jgi:uncharacterized protein (TIGR00725 family)